MSGRRGWRRCFPSTQACSRINFCCRFSNYIFDYILFRWLVQRQRLMLVSRSWSNSLMVAKIFYFNNVSTAALNLTVTNSTAYTLHLPN